MRRVPHGRGVVVVTLMAFLVFLLGTPAVGATDGRSITVTPSVGLTDGETVTVTGSGFIPGSTTDLTICGLNVVSSSSLTTFRASCYFSGFGMPTPDVDGSFVFPFVVHTSGTLVSGAPGPRCGVTPGDCEIVEVGDRTPQFASEPITFASSAPQGNIFATTFKSCTTLHVGYNRFVNGTVVHWRVTSNGVGMVASGQFRAIGGGVLGSKTYHFLDIALGITLPSEASGIQSHVLFTWANGGRFYATRDPGC
jgi:Neocarzinostatin family